MKKKNTKEERRYLASGGFDGMPNRNKKIKKGKALKRSKPEKKDLVLFALEGKKWVRKKQKDLKDAGLDAKKIWEKFADRLSKDKIKGTGKLKIKGKELKVVFGYGLHEADLNVKEKKKETKKKPKYDMNTPVNKIPKKDLEKVVKGIFKDNPIVNGVKVVEIKDDDIENIFGPQEEKLSDSAIGKIQDLKKCLREFDENGKSAQYGNWSIGAGGYDLHWEIYYDGMALIQNIAGKVEEGSSIKDATGIEAKVIFNALKEWDESLRVPTQLTEKQIKEYIENLDYSLPRDLEEYVAKNKNKQYDDEGDDAEAEDYDGYTEAYENFLEEEKRNMIDYFVREGFDEDQITEDIENYFNENYMG